MPVTSSLILEPVRDLADIPLGSNGDIIRLQSGGYAVIVEMTGLGVSVLRIHDGSGRVVKNLGFTGSNPSITELSTGQLVVATDQNGTIGLRTVSSNYATVSAPVSIDLGQPISQSNLAPLGNGSFAVVFPQDFGTDRDILLQFWSGNVEDAIFEVEVSTALDSFNSDVAVLTNGNIVVTRTQREIASNVTKVVFSVYSSAGVLLNNVTLPDTRNSNANDHARVAATATGFAIVHETQVFSGFTKDIQLRTYDFNGVQTGAQIISNPDLFATGSDDGLQDTAPEISVGPDGNIVVSWTSTDGTNSNHSVVLVGSQGIQPVGFSDLANEQVQSLVTFFGTGQIATYHYDATVGSMVGQQFVGFRDSFGTSGNDTFAGDDFVDLINGLAGRDSLSGGNNNDIVQGGDGSDTLNGGNGNDTLMGEEGNGASVVGSHSDTLFGGDGNDVLMGEDGADLLDAGNGSDTLYGGIGNDRLRAKDGSDYLSGGDGNDSLNGDGFNDTLLGGAGIDTLVGGTGADQFTFQDAVAGSGDRISDFATSVDKIGLSMSFFSATLDVAVDAGELRFGTAAADANDFLIYDSLTGRLTYDANGSAAGAGILLATLKIGAVVVADDFVLF